MLKITSKVKPIILIILDGWGIAQDTAGNAITQANPKNFNSLWFSYPHTYLKTTGPAVGLPEGAVGNSEVGHQNLGAGKIVMQDVLRINNAISNGTFYQNEALLDAIEHAKNNNSNINLMGLISPGCVHSYTDHLLAILMLIKESQFPDHRVLIHVFTDGRDGPPTLAKTYVGQLEETLKNKKIGTIASICGRYFAMDRDNRWDRTQKAYETLTGTGVKTAQNAAKAIEDSYQEGITDEFIEPVSIVDANNQKIGFIKDNDSVIFFNFRPDRARQLTIALTQDNFKKIKTSSGEDVNTFERGEKLKNLFFVTLTEYEKNLANIQVAFKPQQIDMPLARVFADRNLRQFHIAETEKYAHVTYFFNGGREAPFDGEERLLVNSPKVATYEQTPEMSAGRITEEVVKRINSMFYDFMVINFANADMLAHTGNIPKTITAIKFVDECIGIISKATLARGGGVIITADHGNAEQMINPQTGGPDTEHNSSPAPFILALQEFRGQSTQLKMGLMADVAPTILGILNIPKPSQMTGRNLLD